ncbi:MAG TPA: hypothetical protein VEJ84_05235 [Acidimicrobiales bacterium]|nr:hypothetical protein [Acidimicrobiales bacterium]
MSAASPATTGNGATGNGATIAFYTESQRAYTNIPAVRVVRRGFLSYVKYGANVTWHWGSRPPKGYTAATESILEILNRGVITFYDDTARAPGLPQLTIDGSPSGTWSVAAGQTCYTKVASPSGTVSLGQPFVGVVGHFDPMKVQGKDLVVTSVYPWGRGSTATEVDTMSSVTKQILGASINVSGADSFTFTVTNKSVAKPRSLPAPSPACSKR